MLVSAKVTVALCALLCIGASCRPIPEDRASAFAATAGQATMVLGGCQNYLTIGYESCILQKGAKLPHLQIAFMNQAEYSISDCELNLFKTGSVSAPGLVEIDLSGLESQVNRLGFCLLKVEAIERYQDPRDKNQFHPIPLFGGFFLETVDPGYIPDPPKPVTAWCVQVRRTTKGRTVMEGCK